MPLRRQHKEPVLAPRELLVVLENCVNLDRLAHREEGVPIVVVVVRASGLPEQISLIEEVAFMLGHSHARTVRTQERRPPALVTMMMRVQHPFDGLDANVVEVV